MSSNVNVNVIATDASLLLPSEGLERIAPHEICEKRCRRSNLWNQHLRVWRVWLLAVFASLFFVVFIFEFGVHGKVQRCVQARARPQSMVTKYFVLHHVLQRDAELRADESTLDRQHPLV